MGCQEVYLMSPLEGDPSDINVCPLTLCSLLINKFKLLLEEFSLNRHRRRLLVTLQELYTTEQRRRRVGT